MRRIIVLSIVALVAAVTLLTILAIFIRIPGLSNARSGPDKPLGVLETRVEVTSTPTITPTPAELPTAIHTPTDSNTQSLTPTPTNTPAPTPLPPPQDFNFLAQEYDRDKKRFESDYVNKTLYVQGQVYLMNKRDNGFVIVFNGDGLNLVCELPPAELSEMMGLSQGHTVIAYGHTKLDQNLFSDTDLLIESCSIAKP